MSAALPSIMVCPDCKNSVYECTCRAISDDESESTTSSTIPTFTSTPQQLLIQKSMEWNHTTIYSETFAKAMDAADPLASYRSLFHIPRRPTTSYKDDPTGAALSLPSTPHDDDVVYLCGNSLGLMPRSTPTLIQQELNKWAAIGVEGHFRGQYPWAQIDEEATRLSMSIVGATLPTEIAICNSLSVNLHLCMLSFYRPTQQRHKILIESAAFCSDHHIVRSQITYHGYDIEKSLIQLDVTLSHTYITTQDILNAIETYGDEIALILLPGVQFYTGQLFDMEAITAAGHAKGCIVGFDLAHAVGNVPMALHDWKVDFAAWCTYKYLNSGPGAIAGLFIHHQHHTKTQQELPRLQGWWGQHSQIRFQMKAEHQSVESELGAQGWLLSNPAVLPTLCLTTSLQIFNRATIPTLREKSYLLTGFLECLLYQQIINEQKDEKIMTILTPSDPKQRGCQLSLLLSRPVRPINTALEHAGIICDVREPNVLRVAPTPLYNTYHDVWKFVIKLKQIWEQTA